MPQPTRFFLPGDNFKAGRPFVMNGVNYNYDDPVDVKGIDPRRVRLMFDARLLEVDDRTEEERKVKIAALKKRAKPAPASQAEEPQRPAEHGKPVRTKHFGFGKHHVVDEAGRAVAGPFSSKEEAQKALETLQAQQ